ncbi:hypothetical protein PAAG_04962, partial [Paracoccidioides lutzii Pb01]
RISLRIALPSKIGIYGAEHLVRVFFGERNRTTKLTDVNQTQPPTNDSKIGFRVSGLLRERKHILDTGVDIKNARHGWNRERRPGIPVDDIANDREKLEEKAKIEMRQI